jgi:hypothetical protein
MTSQASSAFERLARDFLARHSSVRHEWRSIQDRLWGDRVDLVFPPASTTEPIVWASLSEVQIAVGAGSEHSDFEAFGRRMSDGEIAQEAFNHLITLLRKHGYVVD